MTGLESTIFLEIEFREVKLKLNHSDSLRYVFIPSTKTRIGS